MVIIKYFLIDFYEKQNKTKHLKKALTSWKNSTRYEMNYGFRIFALSIKNY